MPPKKTAPPPPASGKKQGTLASFFGGAGASASASRPKRSESMVIDSSSDEEETKKPAPPPKKATPRANAPKQAPPTKKRPAPDSESEDDADDDDDYKPEPKPTRKSQGQASKPQTIDDSDSDLSDEPAPKPSRKAPTPKKGKAVVQELDSEPDDKMPAAKPASQPAPKKRAVAPSSAGKPTPKRVPAAKAAGNKGPPTDDAGVPSISIDDAFEQFVDEEADTGAAGKDKWTPKEKGPPAEAGSKPIPEGEPNCLKPFVFVFTGDLSSIGRDEAQSLVKRYGARVTGAPSSKTTHLVIGTGAGKSKLNKIKSGKLPCKIIDEDGFLALISRSKGGETTEEQKAKERKDQEQIESVAREMQQQEDRGPSRRSGGTDADGPKKEVQLGSAASGASTLGGTTLAENQLWTTKYAPRRERDLVGNKAAVTKLKEWLAQWNKARQSNFKKPGPKLYGNFRAAMVSGPPGVGKTSAAHLVAHLVGYTPVEFNASDTRSKKLVEQGLRQVIGNTNINKFYNSNKTIMIGKEQVPLTNKTVLIMDEVDGMSGGDRGGVGAINALIKKTNIPIICIANDRKQPKMKPFEHTTLDITFRKPDAQAVKSRLMSIAVLEKFQIDPNVMLSFVEGSQNDIRQCINMLSTWALTNRSMNFDESKAIGADSTRNGINTPWTLYSELTGPHTWSHNSKKTLNDKTNAYFQESMMMPLFMFENYVKQRPALAMNRTHRDLGNLEQFSRAADSMSLADNMDTMIHGTQQHWSLMPAHAILSTVAPAYHVHGQGSFATFPQWFGHNSKQQKLRRNLADIGARMRAVASTSTDELVLSYEPVLFDEMTKPMVDDGADGVDEVIQTMDDYFLTPEDRDTILELGVGYQNMDDVLKHIKPQAKSAFTRKYNQMNHATMLYKGDMVVAKPQAIDASEKPDLEEAFEEDEEPPSDDDEKPNKADDITKDRFIKPTKKAPAKKTAAKGKGKGKDKKAVDSDDD